MIQASSSQILPCQTESLYRKQKARSIAVDSERKRRSKAIPVKISDQAEAENSDNDGDESQEASRKTTSSKRKASSTTASEKVLEEVFKEVKEASKDSLDEDSEYGIRQSTSFKSDPCVKSRRKEAAGTKEITLEVTSNLDHLHEIKIDSELATHVTPSIAEVGEKEKQDDDQSDSGSSPPKNDANLDDQHSKNEVNMNKITNSADQENEGYQPSESQAPFVKSSEMELVAQEEVLLAQLRPIENRLKGIRQQITDIRSSKESNEKQKEMFFSAATYNAEILKEQLEKKN
ncbi:DNA ligase 1-like [Glycine soja]|nr:DNA ligase 1-like [Glycine soja]